MSDNEQPVVTHEPAQHRYEIALDGTRVGSLLYIDDGDRRIFHHTEIGDEYGGRGLAGTLVRSALTATRDEGKRIVPVCPYVRKWVGSHDDVTDAVDPVTPAAIATVEEALR
ncbi:GNAT family N-acetyltransferase [Pseudonocardia parietis]|uniref:GNAT family acetyltransferase n=1 Tax=Pseudonocardia parietis TaxID=570936 RepID=A0ABS4VS45_9PSEU|nr:GNAT family N-acetyltransferase [Pseudonocardia parietis]MBP2366596.1 putative GNAT family acetyltransferase [Pseudonocardia parietis]